MAEAESSISRDAKSKTVQMDDRSKPLLLDRQKHNAFLRIAIARGSRKNEKELV